MAVFDMTVHEDVLATTVKLRPGPQHHHPHLRTAEGPVACPGQGQGQAQGRRPVGRQSHQPVPHHVAQRCEDRSVWRRELHRAPEFHHGRQGSRRGHRRQVLPDRRTQGRRCIRLSRSTTRDRAVRPDPAGSRVAVHGQLLPRWRLRLRPAGHGCRRHPAGRHEQGALRLAARDRDQGSHRHSRDRVQRQGDLRQGARAQDHPR